MTKAQMIRDAIKENPTLSAKEIAAKLGVPAQYVYDIKSKGNHVPGKRGRKPKNVVSTVTAVTMPSSKESKLSHENALLKAEVEIQKLVIDSLTKMLKERICGAPV